MPLFLTLVGGTPSGSERIRQVSSGQTLSIGRGPDNDWVLQDPARIVGRHHCTVSGEDGRFVLTDLSSNGIYINDAQQATARDSRIVLADGDQFRLGDFTISVSLVDDAAAPHGHTSPGWDRNNSRFGDPHDPLGGDPLGGDPLRGDPLGGDPSRGDPLGDDALRDNPLREPTDDPFARRPGASFPHPSSHVAPKPRATDPFDAAGTPPDNRRVEPDDDLFRGISPSDDWHGAPVSDHAPAPNHSIPPPRVVTPNPSGAIDFDAYLGDLPPRSGGVSSPGFAPVSEPQERTIAPSPQPAQPPRPSQGGGTGGRPSAATKVATDASAALAAFLDGAGVADQRIDDSDPVAALRSAGEIFRAMADGIREILISRATIKGEMRVTQTLIQPRGNNALKFSATPDDAVVSLLTPKRPGYMEPLAAAEEAFADIKIHEMAVIAGMQNALLALLRRFDPAALEDRLTKGRLDAVLPAARKARYWDAFRVTYEQITREAEDDFQAAFGRSFATAYRALAAKSRGREE